MQKFFICQHEDHKEMPIIRILLKQSSLQNLNRKKLCSFCLENQTVENLENCFPFSFLKIIMQNQIKKLISFKTLIQTMDQQELNLLSNDFIIELTKEIETLLIQEQMIQDEDFSEIDEVIKNAIKCYQNLYSYQLKAKIIQFSQNDKIQPLFFKIINQVYSEENADFLKQLYIQQTENLFLMNKFTQSINCISLALKISQDHTSLLKTIPLQICKKFQGDLKNVYYTTLNPNNSLDFYTFDYMIVQTFNQHNLQKLRKENLLNPNLINVYIMLLNQQYESAIHCVKKELKQQPTNEIIIILYIKLLITYSNQFDEAIKFCNQGISQHPECQTYKEAKILLNFFLAQPVPLNFDISEQTDQAKIIYSAELIKRKSIQKAIQCLQQIPQDSECYRIAKTLIQTAIQDEQKQQQDQLQSNTQGDQFGKNKNQIISQLDLGLVKND